MKLAELYPSNWLKADDLRGREVRVRIDRLTLEDLGGERKPALWFAGKQKGLILNRTNADRIAAVHGDDSDGWNGRDVILYPERVNFQGKPVDAIRVRVPQSRPGSLADAARQKREEAVSAPAPDDPFGDDDLPGDF